MFIALLTFSGNALADQYSLPASISHITVGSTGNWYFYPIIGPGVIDYTGAFTGDPPVDYTFHTVANPAGCSSPTRYVLDSKAGNYDDVIDSLKIFGTSKLGLGELILVGGFQFYVSSSSCATNSPKIIRLRYLPAVIAEPVGLS